MKDTLSASDRLDSAHSLRWLRTFPALLGAGFLSAIAIVVMITLTRLDRARAAADRLDPGWRWEELLARRATSPEEEEAARLAQAIGEQLPSDWPSRLRALPGSDFYNRGLAGWNVPPNQLVTGAEAAALTADLAEVSELVDRARTLHGRPRARLMLEGADFPRQMRKQQLLGVVRLCSHDAVQRAMNGDGSGGLQSLLCMVLISQALADEPSILGGASHFGSLRAAVNILEFVLAQSSAGEVELERLQGALQWRPTEAVALAALRGERAWIEYSERTTGIPPDEIKKLAPYLEKRDVAEAMFSLNEAVEAAKRGQRDLTLYLSGAKVQYGILGPDVTMFVRRAVGVEYVSDASVGCALLALAAERYRIQHGKWPEKIEDLQPLVQTIPDDPYGSGPLNMVRTPDGLIFYSVGHDGVDDGGKLDRAKPNTKGVDLGFQLWDVEKRRQPTPTGPQVPMP